MVPFVIQAPAVPGTPGAGAGRFESSWSSWAAVDHPAWSWSVSSPVSPVSISAMASTGT